MADAQAQQLQQQAQAAHQQATQAASQAPASHPGPQLQYLGFFRVAVIKAVAYVSVIYEYAKDISGPLKPGLDRVEGTVKTVVGPVYEKLEGKPDEFLTFVDSKVASVLSLVKSKTPDDVKAKGTQAMNDVHNKGIYGFAMSTYDKYYPVAADYSYKTWKFFLQLPLAPQLVNVVTPSALYGLTKYNSMAGYLKENQTPALKTVGSYLPTAPVADIEKTVKADTDSALKKKKVE